MPTHAPTGSIRASLLLTAILARSPGSLAAPSISIRPCPTSGTSILNNSIKNCGEVRFKKSWGPRTSLRTSYSNALSRSCGRTGSLGIIASRGIKPSATPLKSTNIPLRSNLLTTPPSSSPTRSSNSSTTFSRSASRTFCTITCLAVWAAILPNSTDSMGISTTPPGVALLSMSTASIMRNSRSGHSSSSDSSAKTVHCRKESYSPVSRSMLTRTSASSP